MGELVALLFYLNYFFAPLIQLSFNYDLFRSAGSSKKKVFSILDEEPVLSKTGTLSPETDAGKVIEFENVDFSYGRETVLHDVSFAIDRGEKIAIVGETGAGKSTIAKLILRFYLPTKGDVKFYGESSKDIAQRWARKNIAYVPQESFLFRGSIRDNLIYSNPGKIDLQSELEEIGLLDWFERYENGLDQDVGERGANVSAGERQFIALLRAVLAKRQIIVFDEATANLDIESESSILDATDALLTYQTSVVIAHRLETILNAEKILVMSEGNLVGFDNHENLLSNNKIYHNLFSAWNLVN